MKIHNIFDGNTLLKVLVTTCFITGFFSSCGSSDDKEVKQGVFIDSAVEGVTYVSGDLMGTTDIDGGFDYLEGENVSFYVGDISLGTVKGKPIVTPVDLVPEALDTSNSTVINIARWLQTLDDDGIPENGIRILTSVNEAAAGVFIDFTLSIEEFGSNGDIAIMVQDLTILTNAGERALISPQSAKSHLDQTLVELDENQDNEGENGGEGGNGTSGEITLSGSDVSTLGDKLVVGAQRYFAIGELGTLQPATFVTVSEGVSVSNEGLPTGVSDPSNFFVMIVFQFGISMNITINGVEYLYLCTDGLGSTTTACGDGFIFDTETKTATLSNVSLYGSETDAQSLTLNGSLTDN